MVKLSYEKVNGIFMIMMAGDNKKDILERYYSFWNHGATNGEIHWLNEPVLAYIISSPHRTKRAIVNSCLFKILNENPSKYKGKKQGAILEARQNAENIIKNMEQTSYYFKTCDSDVFFKVSDSVNEE